MKVKHKNSGDVIDLWSTHYYKHDGIYGWLVMAFNREIYFLTDSGREEVTDEFEILEQ